MTMLREAMASLLKPGKRVVESELEATMGSGMSRK